MTNMRKIYPTIRENIEERIKGVNEDDIYVRIKWWERIYVSASRLDIFSLKPFVYKSCNELVEKDGIFRASEVATKHHILVTDELKSLRHKNPPAEIDVKYLLEDMANSKVSKQVLII